MISGLLLITLLVITGSALLFVAQRKLRNARRKANFLIISTINSFRGSTSGFVAWYKTKGLLTEKEASVLKEQLDLVYENNEKCFASNKVVLLNDYNEIYTYHIQTQYLQLNKYTFVGEIRVPNYLSQEIGLQKKTIYK